MKPEETERNRKKQKEAGRNRQALGMIDLAAG
jgi:hypothetical protein